MTKTNVQSTPSNSQRHDTPNNKTHVIKFRVTAEEKASLELTCKLLNLIASFTSSAILNNLFAICNLRLFPTNQIVNCDGRVRPIQGRTLFLFCTRLCAHIL